MDGDGFFLRPVISGVIGGIVAAWLCSRMAAWVPVFRNGKPADVLLRENRFSIWGGNLIFFFGIFLGIAFYQLGYFENSDWRGFALGTGAGCLGALIVIPIQAVASGREMAEAYVAFAISQRTPTIVLYAIVIVGVGGFSAAAVTLL